MDLAKRQEMAARLCAEARELGDSALAMRAAHVAQCVEVRITLPGLLKTRFGVSLMKPRRPALLLCKPREVLLFLASILKVALLRERQRPFRGVSQRESDAKRCKLEDLQGLEMACGVAGPQDLQGLEKACGVAMPEDLQGLEKACGVATPEDQPTAKPTDSVPHAEPPYATLRHTDHLPPPEAPQPARLLGANRIPAAIQCAGARRLSAARDSAPAERLAACGLRAENTAFRRASCCNRGCDSCRCAVILLWR